jgi:hypothetical protein
MNRLSVEQLLVLATCCTVAPLLLLTLVAYVVMRMIDDG